MKQAVKDYDFEYDNTEEVLEIIDNIKETFNETGLLVKGIFKYDGKEISVQGDFDDTIWVVEHTLTHTYTYFDFSKLSMFQQNSQDLDLILLIKSWLSHIFLLKEFNSAKTLKNYFSNLVDFIIKSNNFDKRFLDLSGGEWIRDYFNEIDCLNQTKIDKITHVMSYLEFLDTTLDISDDVYENYHSELNLVVQQYSFQANSKSLPGSKDVVIFSYFLDKFYKECTNEDLKLLYMPILIWWKLGNVIPLRISEITRTLKRDCIINEEGKYYIKIKRVKERRKSANALPLLDKFEISAEIAQLIENYITLTDSYGKSKTLFSRRALKALRKNIVVKGHHYRHLSQRKYNEDYFSAALFSTLLNAFYEDVIIRGYGVDSIKKRVTPNDPRHFAFFSLLLQGLSPIQIALLGGHSTLKTQANYQYGVSYYVDSELYQLLSMREATKDYIAPHELRTLKEIVFNMPAEPSKEGNCLPLKIGICTCDFEGGEICENFKACHLCKKWWCSPTTESYLSLVEYVKNDLLENAIIKLNDDLSFLTKLLENNIVTKECDDLTTDYKHGIKVKTWSNKVKTDCKEIVELRYSLINSVDEMKFQDSVKQIDGFKYLEQGSVKDGEEEARL